MFAVAVVHTTSRGFKSTEKRLRSAHAGVAESVMDATLMHDRELSGEKLRAVKAPSGVLASSRAVLRHCSTETTVTDFASTVKDNLPP